MLGWLLRAILLTILINLILRLILPSRRTPRAGPAQPSPGPRSVERTGGTLVRDPNCGTYIPESRAIRVGSGTAIQFFCSEECRAAYASAKTGS
jgi:hypothetical protein